MFKMKARKEPIFKDIFGLIVWVSVFFQIIFLRLWKRQQF